MKTAIDYLSGQINDALLGVQLTSKQHYLIVEAIRVSKDLYQYEIKNAYNDGKMNIIESMTDNKKILTSNEYYNETYNQNKS